MATKQETGGIVLPRPKGPSVHTQIILSGAAAAVGLGVWGVNETVPAVNQAVHRMVDKAFLGHLSGNQLNSTDPIKTKDIFENGTKKYEIGDNLHFISIQEARQSPLEPVIDMDAKTITFIMPFKIPDNATGTIERIDLADTDPNAQDPTQRPPVAIFDCKFDNIVTVVAPENSHMYLVRGIQDWGQDPDLAGQVRFYKYYKEQDTTVVWWFTDNNLTKLGSFKNLLPMKDFEKKQLRGADYENLPTVNLLTDIMETTEPNQPVQLAVMAYKGKNVGPDAEIAGDDFLLTPIFSTSSTNGTEQMLALKRE